MGERDPLSELLAREAEVPAPGPEARARVREGIEASLGGGGPPPASDAPPSLPGPGLSTIGVLGIVGASALGAGLALLVVTFQDRESPPPPPSAPAMAAADSDVEAETEPKPEPESTALEQNAETRGEPTVEPAPPEHGEMDGTEGNSDIERSRRSEPDERPPARPNAKAEVEPEPEPEPESEPEPTAKGFAQEYALVQSILQAINGGDNERALRFIKAHERDYPKGQLLQEREAARVRVLCAQGHEEAAAKAVGAFVRRFPSSSHRARLERGCGK